ncbi:18774_t:CDS:1, partial [Acaulospora morrowiae]
MVHCNRTSRTITSQPNCQRQSTRSHTLKKKNARTKNPQINIIAQPLTQELISEFFNGYLPHDTIQPFP